ncbi:MAG: nitrilase-related carbon-nitrogen hydrolase, partial [Pseudomonadota bacterium]|nr:nitrilase-related carbon-nitrogen hydrolase [Pseudomonadota bacterium]
MTTLRIVTAQINPVVGDIEGNTDKILNAVEQAMQAHNPQLILFPELVVTGYPPEDLLLRSSISHRVERALARIAKAAKETYIVVGYPRSREQGLYNTAGVFYRGRLLH